MNDHPEGHPRSRRVDYETPPWLFERLHQEFRFTVDACAHGGNAKLPRFWTEAEDGLAQPWAGETVWCNPPYGRAIVPWLKKAATELRRSEDGRAVLLVPARTETDWWAEYVVPRAAEIRFIRGRVHFTIDGRRSGNHRGSRPVFASVVVVFDGELRLHARGALLSSFPTPWVAKHEALPLLERHP